MKLRAPEYYKNFHCIAEKCKESCCCAGWEIDIDKKTALSYSKVSGEFGKKLRQNIDFNEEPHFILEKDGKCPFFNNHKLCEIYINLGQNSLCNICQEHPRYYEWFDGFKECGIGLCCEEAARIILSQNQKFSTYETEIPYESVDTYDKELYTYLYIAREKIISHLEDTSLPFNSRVRDVIWYSYNVQQKIYDKDFSLLNIEQTSQVDAKSSENLKPILKVLLKLEPCNDDWIPYLKDCINMYEDYSNKILEFESSHPEIHKYLQNMAIYFVWRYFLKATFDEDVLSKIGLMAISISVIRYLFFCEWLKNGYISFDTCIHIAKRFSEEIEYSDNNLIALADACYELQSFSVQNLIEVFYN